MQSPLPCVPPSRRAGRRDVRAPLREPIQRPHPRRRLRIPFRLLLAAALAFAAEEALADAVATQDLAASACDGGGPRTLAEVLDLVRTSPRLAEASSRSDALASLVDQAGVRPNPEIQFELEDFTGSGGYSAFGQSQATLSISQRVELGHLRQRRREAAAREADSGQRRSGLETQDALASAKAAVLDLLVARRMVEAATEAEGLARELVAWSRRRLDAGEGSGALAQGAAVELEAAALQVLGARLDERSAAIALARSFGGSPGEGACILDTLPSTVPVTGGEAVPLPADAPDVALADALVEARRAALELERAKAVPDLQIGAGLRNLAGPDAVSLVAGLRVEVPLFDRNRSAIDAAGHELAAAQAKAASAFAEASADASLAASRAEAAAAKARLVETNMLPAAKRAWSSAMEAWRSGAGSAWAALEARRSLLATQVAGIEALAEHHRARILLERLRGEVTPSFRTLVHDGRLDSPAASAPRTASGPEEN